MEKDKVIHSVAPTRICDFGGWTDTWFAETGAVFNCCIYPYVEVQIQTVSDGQGKIVLYLENFAQKYEVDLHNSPRENPLIEAALEMVPLPAGLSLEISIHSDMPAGASTGTSAAITVALIGALDALSDGRLAVAEVARLAHEVETEKLGQQSGIQDQLAAAYGGINFIEMQMYPFATVSPVSVPNAIWWELEQRLMLVYVGKPHNSSAIHQMVIEKLGENARDNAHMTNLRRLARQAKDALCEGNFAKFGKLMNTNTTEQAAMHPGLVNDQFRDIIEIGRTYGCVGAKVNGAGGDGGTITLLTNGDMPRKRQLVADLGGKGYQVIPIYLARQGLRVWEA